MQLVSTLANGPQCYRGEGINHDQQSFLGTLRVQPIEDGRAVLLNYVATLPDGAVVHSETALIGIGPNGILCLWPVMGELPVVLPHELKSTEPRTDEGIKATFATGTREASDAFREEISIALRVDGSVIYAHAWGLPGGQFSERSSCTLRPTVSG